MIAIPNIDKPKRCDDCWALDDKYDYPMCLITQEQRGYDFNTRAKVMGKCPLIEIDESEMEYLYKVFGLEKDENLTDRAIELKYTILMGYVYAKREIVPCGECKYWHESKCWNIKGLNKTDGIVNADDFCSYGERKDE